MNPTESPSRTYILRHRDELCQLLTAHAGALGDTHAADAARRRILKMCAALCGYGNDSTVTICHSLYPLLGDVADAHQRAHACHSAGAGACPTLKRLYALRAAMVRTRAYC